MARPLRLLVLEATARAENEAEVADAATIRRVREVADPEGAKAADKDKREVSRNRPLRAPARMPQQHLRKRRRSSAQLPPPGERRMATTSRPRSVLSALVPWFTSP